MNAPTWRRDLRDREISAGLSPPKARKVAVVAAFRPSSRLNSPPTRPINWGLSSTTGSIPRQKDQLTAPNRFRRRPMVSGWRKEARGQVPFAAVLRQPAVHVAVFQFAQCARHRRAAPPRLCAGPQLGRRRRRQSPQPWKCWPWGTASPGTPLRCACAMVCRPRRERPC